MYYETIKTIYTLFISHHLFCLPYCNLDLTSDERNAKMTSQVFRNIVWLKRSSSITNTLRKGRVNLCYRAPSNTLKIKYDTKKLKVDDGVFDFFTVRFYSSTSSTINISDEEEVRYYNSKNEAVTLKFSELKELARKQYHEKGRNLVEIKLSGDQLRHESSFGTFRTLQNSELEDLVRKNRQHQKQRTFRIISPSVYLDMEIDHIENDSGSSSNNLSSKSGKLRQKQLPIKVGIGNHDLQAAITRINKWLSSGTTFVTVSIAAKGKRKEGMELENNIKSQLDNDAIKMLTIKVLS